VLIPPHFSPCLLNFLIVVSAADMGYQFTSRYTQLSFLWRCSFSLAIATGSRSNGIFKTPFSLCYLPDHCHCRKEEKEKELKEAKIGSNKCEISDFNIQ